jgi:hypothetical protein
VFKLLRKKKGLISSNEDVDPMSYGVNIVDCMLVLAVGFMLFAIMSMNMQNIVFGDMNPEERAKMIESINDAVQIEKGEEINQSLHNSSSGSDEGYSEIGTVYEDPKTGKMVMIPNS